MNVYKSGKNRFQLGPNNNLYDFTYVKNVAHAHLLAARALLQTYKSTVIPLDHERVDGEAFFVTNGEPAYFWDFLKAIWALQGSQMGANDFQVIGKKLGIFMGWLTETICWCLGRQPLFTRQRVIYTNMTRYFNIEKARTRLGYMPLYGLHEGLERSVKWFLEEDRRLEKETSEKKSQWYLRRIIMWSFCHGDGDALERALDLS